MTNIAQIMSIDDLEILDGEPRISDTRLATILGFRKPRDIRALISRNQAMLDRFGIAPKRSALSPVGAWGGQQTVTITYLNRRQALFLATKSGTSRAAEMTVQMVEIFDQWLSEHRLESVAPAVTALPSPVVAPEVLQLLRPEVRACLRYCRMGLSGAEIARLLRRPARTVQKWRAGLRVAGMLEAAHG